MKHLVHICLAVLILHATVISQPKVPQWAKDAIWYQIFPERFRNSDPVNDPTAADLELAPERGWRISPWTSDWYKLQPWEEKHSKNFFDNVFERRYGGDLQGVLDKLAYLADLGINAIYFNPVFDAISLHKYDASTYHHIDKNFGPAPQGDLELMRQETDDPATWKWTAADSLFLKLVREAHKRGIRVIIDGVFNHCGTRFWAFQDVIRNQQSSRYAEWFDVKRWDDPATRDNEFDYKGWWDIKMLPEFREVEGGFAKPVWDYFFNITRRWMDPNGDGDSSDGIDGWRLDVANDVSHVFWKGWRTLVKSVNPNAYIVGEIWDDASNWLAGDQFDAVMNYRFARAVVRFFIDTGAGKYTPSDFDKELADVRKSYPAEVNYILQNLIDSHDTDRLPSMIVNPNRKYDDQNGLRWNQNYDVSKPTAKARQIQKLIVLFQMTYLGAPMIYYGDEAGMWGADDPDDRKPMVWPELTYDNEKMHPVPGKMRMNDVVRFDKELFDYYKKLVQIRKENVALRRGDFTTLLDDDNNDVYAFQRKAGNNEIIVIINNSELEQVVGMRLIGARSYREALTGVTVEGTDRLVTALRPKSASILARVK
ncbi:MAG: glycoside hydrolase family 13 protein [Bacteroidota bacterium]